MGINYPLFPGAPHPEEIIGDGMHLFIRHYKKAVEGEFGDIPQDVRQKIAMKWQAIREAGWRAYGIENDRIQWRYIADNYHDVNREWNEKYGFNKMTPKEAREWVHKNKVDFSSACLEKPVEEWELAE